MTALDIATRVERHGGILAIGDDGRLVLRKPRGVPANLVEDIRRHKTAIREMVAARSGGMQLALSLPAPSTPRSFIDDQEAKFDRLCAEFGIAVEASR